MQVFKACFKILKKNLGLIIMYVFIFAAVGSSFAALAQDEAGEFVGKEAKVAILNLDESAEIAAALTDYLDGSNKIVEVENDRKQIDDALFFRSAEYIIRIPSGFTARFASADPLPLEVFSVPGTMAEVNVNMQIEQFFGSLRAYLNNTSLPVGQALVRVAENLSVSSELTSIRPQESYTALTFLFRWLTYAVVLIMIVSIVPLMMSFTNPMVRMRNEIGSVNRNRLAMRRYVVYAILAAAILLVELAVCAVIGGGALFTVRGGVMALNLVALGIFGLSLAFLLGMVLRSDIGVSIASNVIGLTLAFLSGAFVEQAVLSKGVLAAAKLLPTYWYVRNVEAAAKSYALGGAFVADQVLGICIVLGFAVVLFLAALAVNRHKRRNA